MAFLSWTDSGLFGVSPEGAVATSQDDGETWALTGQAGGVTEALLVTEDAIYVAVRESGITQSTDGGATFELLVPTSDGA